MWMETFIPTVRRKKISVKFASFSALVWFKRIFSSPNSKELPSVSWIYVQNCESHSSFRQSGTKSHAKSFLDRQKRVGCGEQKSETRARAAKSRNTWWLKTSWGESMNFRLWGDCSFAFRGDFCCCLPERSFSRKYFLFSLAHKEIPSGTRALLWNPISSPSPLH